LDFRQYTQKKPRAVAVLRLAAKLGIVGKLAEHKMQVDTRKIRVALTFFEDATSVGDDKLEALHEGVGVGIGQFRELVGSYGAQSALLG